LKRLKSLRQVRQNSKSANGPTSHLYLVSKSQIVLKGGRSLAQSFRNRLSISAQQAVRICAPHTDAPLSTLNRALRRQLPYRTVENI
jgi:hypothetical protein